MMTFMGEQTSLLRQQAAAQAAQVASDRTVEDAATQLRLSMSGDISFGPVNRLQTTGKEVLAAINIGASATNLTFVPDGFSLSPLNLPEWLKGEVHRFDIATPRPVALNSTLRLAVHYRDSLNRSRVTSYYLHQDSGRAQLEEIPRDTGVLGLLTAPTSV
jgi:hypothetical protein